VFSGSNGGRDSSGRASAPAADRAHPDVDLIALTQFSLSRAQKLVAAASGKTVLTTPDSAVRKLKDLLAVVG